MTQKAVLVLVDELFRRSAAGVFAQRKSDGTMVLRSKRQAYWVQNLGLAARLQSRTVDQHHRPQAMRLTAGYAALDDADLELATTDTLVAELYRRAKDDWVLGLVRHSRRKTGPWSGLCWHGDGIVCAGLASALAQRIQAGEMAKRLKTLPLDTPELELPKFFNLVMRHIRAESTPCRTWMAGVIRTAEHIAGTYGPECVPDTDLKEFVNID